MKRLELTSSLNDLEVRESGTSPSHFTIRGHAAVFDRLSEPLGFGFREKIAKGAFTNVLDTNPDVRLLIDHNPSTVLARTTNGSLELREDPQGLHVWARIRSDLPEAAGLRARLEDGLVDQMSFAFTIRDEEQTGEDENGLPIYTVRDVGELYDASTTTYGAYTSTDVSLVRMRMLDKDEGIAREHPHQDDRSESGTAAAEQDAIALRDREFQVRKRKAIARARILVPRP